MNNNFERLNELYNEIPTFICKEGCSSCCGPVPWSKSEWDAIEEKRTTVGLDCPYEVKGCGCLVYKNRPFMCRLFGTVDWNLLRCPYGCRPANLLTPERARELTRKYHNMIDK